MDHQTDQRWQVQQLTNISEVCGNGSSHQEQMTACLPSMVELSHLLQLQKFLQIVLSSADFIQNQMQSGYLSRSHREETGFKAAGTLHPLQEVTKTLNNRGPQKVLRESRMYLRIQHQQDSLNFIPRLHFIMATLLHTPPPLLLL
ncbi:hypothetical protein PVL29_020730 [Vitis rotundifolia]|uniref:Uncharacterized protein n=1 Tax=Vitis rotundifolia TaxID=103349 RepID=A0AA39DCK4_VITRO|nr:hypothetical protein PVL29_020730 [Vitis rotundifolia]